MLIRSEVWPQIETFISAVLMICENNQENQLLYLVCYNLFETIWTSDRHLVTVKYTSRQQKKFLWDFANGDRDRLIEVEITVHQGT